MPVLARIRSLARNLLRANAVAGELDRELDAYLEMVVAEKIERGTPPDRARQEALAAMRGKAHVHRRVRERRTGAAVEALAQDLSLGARLIARNPAFSLVAILTLALGIGASTAVFSVVDGVLLRALPYPEPDRLAFVGPRVRDSRPHFSPPDFVDFSETTQAFEAVCAIQVVNRATLTIDGQVTSVQARLVTTNILSVYGVSPVIGRGFGPGDGDAMAFTARTPNSALPPSVVLIGHRLWQDRFAGDPAVLGTLVELDFQPHEIIGVMPPGFDTMIPGASDDGIPVDVFAPSRMDFATMPRDSAFLNVVGRVKPGTTLAEAQAEASVFAERQRGAHVMHREAGFEIDVRSLQTSLTRRHAASIMILFGGAGLLLLIACANLAGLLLTRAVARQQEFAVRMALGSSRGRLVRQVLTESALFAFFGVALGLPFAHWLTRVLVQLAPASIPRIGQVGLGTTAFAFAAVCALAATTVVSLLPALRLTRAQGPESLRSTGRTVARGRRPWDRAIVVVEVALAVILLTGSALLLRSFVQLHDVDPGFRADQALAAELALTERRYPRYPRADSRVRFARELTDRVSRVPRVDAAALALVVPLSAQDAGHSFATEDMAASSLVFPPAKYRPVTPGYFRAIGTTLVAGRDFDWNDLNQERLVTIVDERLARRAWPGQDPIGQRLRIETWSTDGGGIHLAPLWTEVVGVAQGVRSSHLGVDDGETVYVPYSLYAVSGLSLIVRASAPPTSLVESIRAEAAQVDPDVALFNVRTLNDHVAASMAPQRFSLDLLGAFALTGLALALIGIYAVLAHAVRLREREIGVRVALGARPWDMQRLVLDGGARLILAGVAIGLVSAWGLSRFLEAQLYGVSPVSGAVYSGVAAVVLLVGVAACYVPARRAARIDPVAMLRLE